MFVLRLSMYLAHSTGPIFSIVSNSKHVCAQVIYVPRTLYRTHFQYSAQQ